ncbi:Os03g0744200, partial [Oryza sativa Japonica Group]
SSLFFPLSSRLSPPLSLLTFSVYSSPSTLPADPPHRRRPIHNIVAGLLFPSSCRPDPRCHHHGGPPGGRRRGGGGGIRRRAA